MCESDCAFCSTFLVWIEKVRTGVGCAAAGKHATLSIDEIVFLLRFILVRPSIPLFSTPFVEAAGSIFQSAIPIHLPHTILVSTTRYTYTLQAQSRGHRTVHCTLHTSQLVLPSFLHPKLNWRDRVIIVCQTGKNQRALCVSKRGETNRPNHRHCQRRSRAVAVASNRPAPVGNQL